MSRTYPDWVKVETYWVETELVHVEAMARLTAEPARLDVLT